MTESWHSAFIIVIIAIAIITLSFTFAEDLKHPHKSMKPFGTLWRGSANQGLRATCGPPFAFVNKALLEPSYAHSFIRHPWLVLRCSARDHGPQNLNCLLSGAFQKSLLALV